MLRAHRLAVTPEVAMFSRMKDFSSTWDYEHKATLKILRALTPDSLGTSVNPGGRSLGRLAWHLVASLQEALRQLGMAEGGPRDDAPPPPLAEMVAAYEQVSGAIAERMPREWTDDLLTGNVTLYGMTFTRGQLLGSLITHQAHHRGQMTVLMRQAGLRVPGVYGPAREEWAAMGMPAHT
jgi:uncharacterized damage-inducible protein DinB